MPVGLIAEALTCSVSAETALHGVTRIDPLSRRRRLTADPDFMPATWAAAAGMRRPVSFPFTYLHYALRSMMYSQRIQIELDSDREKNPRVLVTCTLPSCETGHSVPAMRCNAAETPVAARRQSSRLEIESCAIDQRSFKQL